VGKSATVVSSVAFERKKIPVVPIQPQLFSSMPPRSKPPKPVFVDNRKSAPDIARRLKLDHGLGFLVRLLETRATTLYEQLTGQNEITPRQFGAMLTLYQSGTMTLTELATRIRVDRSTLGEMINRMADRGLVRKELNDADRRSATVTLAKPGEQALLRLVAGAAQLQEELLAPLPAGDRAHFLRCIKRVAEPRPSDSGKD
jgi:DNA-binding MarR family transcriptional regulator